MWYNNIMRKFINWLIFRDGLELVLYVLLTILTIIMVLLGGG